MLVSSIARFDALNSMNNTAFASMQLSHGMMRFAHHGATFSGDNDLNVVQKNDVAASKKITSSGLLHKLAYYQEQMTRDLQTDEIKKYTINFVA